MNGKNFNPSSYFPTIQTLVCIWKKTTEALFYACSHHVQKDNIFTSRSAVRTQSSAEQCRRLAADRPVTQSMVSIRCMDRMKFGPRYVVYDWLPGVMWTSRTVASWNIRSLWFTSESNIGKSGFLQQMTDKCHVFVAVCDFVSYTNWLLFLAFC